jgi:hypothetical protein
MFNKFVKQHGASHKQLLFRFHNAKVQPSTFATK